jgi:hypothetical protein
MVTYYLNIDRPSREQVTNSNVQTVMLNRYAIIYRLYGVKQWTEFVEAQSAYKALKIFLNSISESRKRHIQIIKIV